MKARFLVAVALAISCVIAGFLIGAVFTGAGLKPGPALVRARAWIGYGLEHLNEDYQLAGREIFQSRCSVCHGVADNDAVRLAQSAFRSYVDIGVFRVIANGEGKGDMPAYHDSLGDREILQTVAYLKGIGGTPQLPTELDLPLPDGEYEYVAISGGLLIYSIDDNFQLVGRIRVPGLRNPRGIAVHAQSSRVYVSFHGEQSAPNPVGRIAAIDLKTGVEVWRRSIEPGVDSLAVTSDGKTIYVPDGEHLDHSTGWTVLDTEFGRIIDRITFGQSAHNTQVSPDGKWVYLASIGHDYMGVVDTATHEVVGEIGTFGAGLRPFALTADGRFALVNVDHLSGFVVADLNTREIIHRVEVEGWPWESPPSPRTQSHGIALTPDGREAWVSDSWNRQMHVFDVSRLPDLPIQGKAIPLSGLPKWMRFTRDGRWMHVSTGEIINAKTHNVAAQVAHSRCYVQVTWRDGQPIAGYSRYGNSYTSQ